MKVYHADHGVSEETLAWAVAQVAPGFFARTFTLPEWAADLLNGLYGPASGDSPVQDVDTFRAQRSADRPLSRMVRRPARPTRLVTVIGVAPEAGGEAVVFTAYGGPLAAREPGDATLPPGSPDHAEAVAFWAEHALSCSLFDAAFLAARAELWTAVAMGQAPQMDAYWIMVLYRAARRAAEDHEATLAHEVALDALQAAFTAGV